MPKRIKSNEFRSIRENYQKFTKCIEKYTEFLTKAQFRKIQEKSSKCIEKYTELLKGRTKTRKLIQNI